MQAALETSIDVEHAQLEGKSLHIALLDYSKCVDALSWQAMHPTLQIARGKVIRVDKAFAIHTSILRAQRGRTLSQAFGIHVI